MATARKTAAAKKAAEKDEKIVAAEEAAAPEETPKAFEEMHVKCGADLLNVRDEPNGAVIKTVPEGSTISVAPGDGGWREVEGGGFVRADLVG